MEWQIIIAILVMVPVILLPVAIIWYVNFDSLRDALKKLIPGRSATRKTRQ